MVMMVDGIVIMEGGAYTPYIICIVSLASYTIKRYNKGHLIITREMREILVADAKNYDDGGGTIIWLF